MDLIKALRELHRERDRVSQLIAICEAKIKEQDRSLSRSKRGRKAMSNAEKEAVRERMRTYWAKKRAAEDSPVVNASSAGS